MVAVVEPALVVCDGDVLRAEVVGDGHDAINEGEHQVVPGLGAVHPEQDGLPPAGDEGQAQAVRLKQHFDSNLRENQNLLRCTMKNFIAAITFERQE